jgi:hypothetical protein
MLGLQRIGLHRRSPSMIQAETPPLDCWLDKPLERAGLRAWDSLRGERFALIVRVRF